MKLLVHYVATKKAKNVSQVLRGLTVKFDIHFQKFQNDWPL